MVNNNFIAIFNPFTRDLVVEYGDCISVHSFEDLDEWCKISFNGDENHPHYLHIQLDYEECLQLIFYPRRDNDESLHEDKAKAFYSMDMTKLPEGIYLAFTDEEFIELSSKHFTATNTKGM